MKNDKPNQITKFRNQALKVGGAGTVAYVVSPIDLIPDFPVIGQIDDVMVIFAFLTFALIVVFGAWMVSQSRGN